MADGVVRTLGINTWVWTSPLTDAALPPLLRMIAGMGFDGVELPLENAGDLTAPAVRDALAETGLVPTVVGAMVPGRELIRADDATIQATQRYLVECVELAGAIGAASVCGPFYSHTGRLWRMDETDRTAACAELRRNLAPVAERAVI